MDYIGRTSTRRLKRIEQARLYSWKKKHNRVPPLRLKQGNIERDGSYAIQGVAVGEAKVAVNSPNPNSGDFQPLQREGRPPPPPRPKISGWFPIPAEYQDLSKPRLTYTVKSGPNTFD